MNNNESPTLNQAPPKKKMSGCLIAILVLIGLGILGVGGCFLITGAAFSQAAKKEKEKLEALKTATPSNLSPGGELADIFNINSKHTDLQRDNKEKEILGKIVQWDLKVNEIKSTGKTYKIQTSGGLNFMEQSPVATFVYITPVSDEDSEYLAELKTDNVVSIIGYIDGTMMRSLEISPAIIYHGSESKRATSQHPSASQKPKTVVVSPAVPPREEKANDTKLPQETVESVKSPAEPLLQEPSKTVQQETQLSLDKVRFEQEKAQLATDRARWVLEKERAQLEREKTQLAEQREAQAAKQAIVRPVDTNKDPVTFAPATATGSATVPAMSGERYPKTNSSSRLIPFFGCEASGDFCLPKNDTATGIHFIDGVTKIVQI